MRLNTNISSLVANKALKETNNNLKSSLEKLGTGKTINKASDDGSGLAIADKLRTEASSISQSIDNANSAVAFINIADRALAEQSAIYDKVRVKLLQAKNGTTSADGIKAISKDISALLQQSDEIGRSTVYNDIRIFQKEDTTFAPTEADNYTFQLGSNAADTVTLDMQSMGTTNTCSLIGSHDFHDLLERYGTPYLELNADAMIAAGGNDTTIRANINDFIDTTLPDIDLGLSKINEIRGEFGSVQLQIESSSRNLMTSYTNLKAAESVIRDVDYAVESANFNKMNIIAQAGSFAVSQANSMQQNITKLLQ